MKVVLLFALVACTRSPTARPRAPGGAIVLVDDLVVRGESDGVVSVMARVTMDDLVAFGVIRLPTLDAARAATSPHVVVALARAWQTVSRMAKTPSQAFEAARRGSEALPACATIIPSMDPHPPDVGTDPQAAAEAVRWERHELEDRLDCYLEHRHGEVL
jgi:hypothetical protein